jgi:sugar lactone lactonase YvrE
MRSTQPTRRGLSLISGVLLGSLASGFSSGQTYTISTFAGGALPVNIPGVAAKLGQIIAVTGDRAGNLFLVNDQTVLRLDAMSGVLTLVAGNGTFGFSGDNGPPTGAQLANPCGIAVDSNGSLYISDCGNYRIRKVSDGVIVTVAGGGTQMGENFPATSVQLTNPWGVAVDSAGSLYVADPGANCVRKVFNGVITTVAGNGTRGYSGDGGQATAGQLDNPNGLAVDSAGNLYIADAGNSRIRKVSNGVITTVAGNGTPAGPGAGNGPATGVNLSFPTGVAVDAAGNLYISDVNFNCIRKVANGVITTLAGSGPEGFIGDNGPATSAALSRPSGVAVDLGGNVYIGDRGNRRIRKVSNGVITTAAGTGWSANGTQLGDNGPATSAQLARPAAVAVDSAGNLYIADGNNSRIRKVSDGVITTIAGDGTPGYSGDNGPATSAQLFDPRGPCRGLGWQPVLRRFR